ncbi:MAG: hypothetical protein BWY22_02483 [Bacteroidetes bacterium ADurb.Bin217]|mgnify:CR=1 FL=1|nr:MAG: hypothetical protein BWY22_02483 [Bacteroidetes bacterium ADurb.Bin217]
MAIINLFSKRQKLLRGEIPEIYHYDYLNINLKIQIVHIINDTIGRDNYRDYKYSADFFKTIKDVLCREYGIFQLNDESSNESEVINFFLNETDVEKSLDFIELSFRLIDKYVRVTPGFKQYSKTKITPDEAITELNERFKEHGFGYQYEGGELIRVDSTYVHSEIVKPTIQLLWNKKFTGANEEYLKAHKHYKDGRNKESLAECLKAFESTMKIICKEKGWSYNQNDTSKKLIEILMNNNLVPAYIQSQIGALRNILEGSVPTIRNRLGGHGQGQIPTIVDDNITRFALNLTGTIIIFIVELSEIK